MHYTIQPYIHNINTFAGTALCVDFFFPNNKTHIISVYLPSNNSVLSTRTQTQISLWFTEAKNRNWHSIILGDFNSNNYTKKIEKKIITYLINYIDNQLHYTIKFSSKNSIRTSLVPNLTKNFFSKTTFSQIFIN